MVLAILAGNLSAVHCRHTERIGGLPLTSRYSRAKGFILPVRRGVLQDDVKLLVRGLFGNESFQAA